MNGQNVPRVRKKGLPLISIGIMIFVFIAFFGVRAMFFGASEKILKTGLPARATILEIEPTGVYFNRQPQVRMLLEVNTATGENYQTEHKEIISPVYLPQFQPGVELVIKYDAKDKKKVAIESVVQKR